MLMTAPTLLKNVNDTQHGHLCDNDEKKTFFFCSLSSRCSSVLFIFGEI